MNLQKRHRNYTLLFAALLIIATSLIFYHISTFPEIEALSPQEQPEIEASLDTEAMVLELKVVDGWFTNWRSGQVRLNQGDNNLTLRGYGEEKETDYWAKDGILSLSTEGITRFPITEDENITVELEELDPVSIKTLHDGNEVSSHTITFKNCEAEVHGKLFFVENETAIEDYEQDDC